MSSIGLRGSKRVWTGRAITAIPVAFLVFDAAIKLVPIDPVIESLTRLGWPTALAREIGLVELAFLAAYLIPRTAIVGAVLLSGFLGGAIATHVRIGDPLFSHELFPTYVAALLWTGLYLRDARVAAIVRAHSAHPRSTVPL